MAKEEIFHVGIEEPKEIRKNILESTRQVIYSLQRFEKLKAVRIEKAEKIILLKKQIIELLRLVEIFRKELPKTKLRAKENIDKIEPLNIPVVKKEIREKRDKPVKEQTTKKINELDKLEYELSQIESKLNNLI